MYGEFWPIFKEYDTNIFSVGLTFNLYFMVDYFEFTCCRETTLPTEVRKTVTLIHV